MGGSGHGNNIVSYAECLKIHEHLGGKTDGCQEFEASGKMGVNCSICSCHRKFHKKVVKVEPPPVVKYKTEVVYTKCHKIHEFKFQNSVDGCQEFTPKGGDGTAMALTCGVCGCHKGFHRNEITKEVTSTD
ncbi:hypothetical protein DH2020_029730 [Rehmannia glutinosa]|uniref:ZF-HD dimerization-type domain-containing protein n=1 Tax=Rehmannia glutinosa TaxID=99300 RepID=A0ABR0VRD2_REHGL